MRESARTPSFFAAELLHPKREKGSRGGRLYKSAKTRDSRCFPSVRGSADIYVYLCYYIILLFCCISNGLRDLFSVQKCGKRGACGEASFDFWLFRGGKRRWVAKKGASLRERAFHGRTSIPLWENLGGYARKLLRWGGRRRAKLANAAGGTPAAPPRRSRGTPPPQAPTLSSQRVRSYRPRHGRNRCRPP